MMKRGEPSWRYRRIVIYAVCIFAGWQLHRLVGADDTRVNETIAWGWQVLLATIVLGYTGFATAQDIAAIWRTRRARPYEDDDRRDYRRHNWREGGNLMPPERDEYDPENPT